MAEGLARALSAQQHEIWSAGTFPAARVSPQAVQALAEKGIDISTHRPKGLDSLPPEIDVAVTLCEESCPNIRARHHEHWPIRDPVGAPAGLFREVRDELETRIRGLLTRP